MCEPEPEEEAYSTPCVPNRTLDWTPTMTTNPMVYHPNTSIQIHLQGLLVPISATLVGRYIFLLCSHAGWVSTTVYLIAEVPVLQVYQDPVALHMKCNAVEARLCIDPPSYRLITFGWNYSRVSVYDVKFSD